MTGIPKIAPATAAPAKRGFAGVCCLACGQEDIRIDVANVTTFVCQNSDCEAEWTPAEIAERLAGWAPLLAWCDQAPMLAE